MFVFGALIALLGTRASADIYIVPPSPVPVALTAGQRVISVDAQVIRSFAAARAYIQLAVIATPQFIPTPVPNQRGSLVKPGVEDATPPPLRALQPVTRADLDKARAALVQWGVPSGTIATAVLPTSDHRGIGQVLIAAIPATSQRYDWLNQRVLETMKRFPQILAAGTVLVRDRCDAQRSVAAQALRQAGERGSILALAAGFTAGERLRDDAWYEPDAPFVDQLLCGGQTPRMPPAAVWSGGLPDLPYRVSVNRGVLFGIGAASARPIVKVHFERIISARSDDLRFAHQFRVPWNEPFVSALGQFKATVRPDMVLAVFRSAQAPGDASSRMWADVDRAVALAGAGHADIMRANDALYVRVPSYSRFVRLANATHGAHLQVNGVPIVRDCTAVRAAVTARALAAARSRALAMTSAAHVRMGSLFAIDDGGETVQALCGYSERSAMTRIVRAAMEQPGNFNDARAVFSSALAAAWRLGVPLARRSNVTPPQPPYPLNLAMDAFATAGARTFGSGTTLQSAALGAQAQLHGMPLQALIDEGTGYGASFSGPFVERVSAVAGI